MAGFVAAALAYGRVTQIERSVTGLLGVMGKRPGDYVRRFNDSKAAELAGFKHRFNTGKDLAELFGVLQKVLVRFGSIENYFAETDRDEHSTIVPVLTAFCDHLSDLYEELYQKEVSRGVKYLLASPARGSASKRLNLFLRWMVRDDEVDPGVWQTISPAKLVVPIDVHMERLCRILGLYGRKTVSLKAALEITESFAKVRPEDPVKYDFSLSRIGIIDNCTGKLTEKCDLCELYGYCLRVRK
ncbi:hypothetical protein STSP2_02665 [Anaerohalosphaera lusitana]|uniref:TIGR02757 family protein n=2 Tax=Anaerohalosphaera lusitana TaxID=1936003 RepID=A0A1U9NP12_9BACT|nr:hypothetical protein STSP2_02665 [Anaerohalosphaera lusitana]